MDCGHPGREYQGGAIAPPLRGDVWELLRAATKRNL
jgi:hypothetical protein